MGYFIPNLSAKLRCVGRGGWRIGWSHCFSVLVTMEAMPWHRFLGATILGVAIGLMVALVEAIFRQAWLEVSYGSRETVRINLGNESVSIGSDSRACSVYVPGAPPVALRYRLTSGRIECQDVPGEQTAEVRPGDQRKAGECYGTVCAAGHTESKS